MAAQTVMVRRVVVGPGVVVAGGVDARRSSALTSRHCEIDTTLAPLKKKRVAQRTLSLHFIALTTRIQKSGRLVPHVRTCQCVGVN